MQDTPYGYCHCGCGQATERWATSNANRGRVKDEPKRYIHGHHRRGLIGNQVAIKWIEQDMGYGTPCWIWQLDHSYDGYGRKWLGSRRVHAHRWTYEQHVGPIPEGLQLDHLCRVRNCVNPDHLEPVTPRENTRRGIVARRLV
jgi:hypothetical protein